MERGRQGESHSSGSHVPETVLWGSRPSVLQQWGAAAGEGKERAQSCTKSAKAERAAHTQTAVNGTIYIPQGEMTKHHRFL